MKRIIVTLLICAITLSGCSSDISDSVPANDDTNFEISARNAENNSSIDTVYTESATDDGLIHVVVGDDEEPDESDYEYNPEFAGLNDESLNTYVEDSIYSELVSALDSEEYYVENVGAVYISQEYIDELTYNSKSNIYFGYTLEDIDACFQGTRYVFTLGEEGDTVVQPFEAYDDTYDQIIKNVAIGTGVILVCVTVSFATAGAGAPAVSLIFATAAKTGTVMALSSGALGGVSAGIVTGIQTGNMDDALTAAELAASEGFKWGAITGVIAGGASSGVSYASAMKDLRGAQLYLTTQEAAAIQMQTGYPASVISQIHSMEEFQVYQDAGLFGQMVNGEIALVRNDIDLYGIVDEMGRNNLVRMQQGLSPITLDEAGNVIKYELHHIGQEIDGTLAILTTEEHDNAALHGFKAISEIDRPEFDTIRKHFWKTMAKLLSEGVI